MQVMNILIVIDSFSFVNDLLSVYKVPFMCSLDVTSLFTNIPVDETIEICLDLLYQNTNVVEKLTRYQFKSINGSVTINGVA